MARAVLAKREALGPPTYGGAIDPNWAVIDGNGNNNMSRAQCRTRQTLHHFKDLRQSLQVSFFAVCFIAKEYSPKSGNPIHCHILLDMYTEVGT